MTEAGGAGAEHLLAQHRAMGQHQGKRGIVADRANVAAVIGQALQFGHQRPQPVRAGGNLRFRRRLDRPSEGQGIGHRAVAGYPPHQPRRPLQRRAVQQALDTLVDITQPLFQPDHGLAVGGEAEMAGFDDAGVNRPHRNLVQAFALRR